MCRFGPLCHRSGSMCSFSVQFSINFSGLFSPKGRRSGPNDTSQGLKSPNHLASYNVFILLQKVYNQEV